MDLVALTALIGRHEGKRLTLYKDSVGKWTIGFGRNLEDIGITDAECDFLLKGDIERTMRELTRAIPWWVSLDEIRQMVLVDMAFMGVQRLLGFKKFLNALFAADYRTAAAEMIDSEWSKQVGSRADELARMMVTGRM